MIYPTELEDTSDAESEVHAFGLHPPSYVYRTVPVCDPSGIHHQICYVRPASVSGPMQDTALRTGIGIPTT